MTPLHALATCAVVLVSGGDAFSKRVEGELAASLACIDVAEALRSGETRTVVRIVSRHAVEIWERGSVAKTLELGDTDEIDSVKVAEHVRARTLAPPSHSADTPAFVESTVSAPTGAQSPPADTNARPAVEDVRAPEPPRFAIAAGVGPVLEADAVGIGARFGVHGRFAGPFRAGALLVVPLQAATLSGKTQGDAEISTLATGPAVDVELRPSKRSALSGTIGVAGLVAFTRTTGFGVSPFVGRTDGQVRFVPTATLGIAYALSPRFGLELAGGAGFALPAVDVRFARNAVGQWGAPYAFGSGGARFVF